MHPYIQCAKLVIVRSRSLRLLSYVQHPNACTASPEEKTLFEVPSWVPRWHGYFTRAITPPPPEEDNKNFAASVSLQLQDRCVDIQGLQ